MIKGTTIKRIRSLKDDDKLYIILMLLGHRFEDDDSAINDYLDGMLASMNL